MEAMRRELDDDQSVIKDVSLVGSDGGRVMAAKTILAIQSPVFRRMFYGNFREASVSCESVEMDFCTPVLRAVVAYCYTHEINLSLLPEGNSILRDQLHDKTAVVLIEVRDAANYFELSKLREGIENILNPQGYGSNLAILEQLMIRGKTNGKLWSRCMERVKTNTLVSLDALNACHNAGIGRISFALLETIIRSGKLCARRAALTLESWHETHNSTSREERSQLHKLADEITMESIKMSEVALMKPCHLSPAERMYKVLANLASQPPIRKRPRKSRLKARNKYEY